jgi:hypothetical protein
MTEAKIVLVVLFFVGLFIQYLQKNRERKRQREEAKEIIRLRKAVARQKREAESKAALALQKAEREKEAEYEAIDRETEASLEQSIEQAQSDPDKAIEDALKEYKKIPGVHIWFPLLFLLQGCATTYGSGGSLTVEIKKSNVQRCLKVIHEAGKLKKRCKAKLQEQKKKCRVNADRQLSQKEAERIQLEKQLDLCKKQPCPSCLPWIISTGVLGGVLVLGAVTAIFAASRKP